MEDDDVAEDEVEDDDVEDDDVKGEEHDDVENDDARRKMMMLRRGGRSQDCDPQFVQACAVEMHMDM